MISKQQSEQQQPGVLRQSSDQQQQHRDQQQQQSQQNQQLRKQNNDQQHDGSQAGGSHKDQHSGVKAKSSNGDVRVLEGYTTATTTNKDIAPSVYSMANTKEGSSTYSKDLLDLCTSVTPPPASLPSTTAATTLVQVKALIIYLHQKRMVSEKSSFRYRHIQDDHEVKETRKPSQNSTQQGAFFPPIMISVLLLA